MSASERWIIKLVLPFVFFALPSFGLVFRVWQDRRRLQVDSTWSDVPRQLTIFFVASYVVWWASLMLTRFYPALAWTTGFVVAWPLLGIVVSLLGCGLAFFARNGEKGKLFLANILCFALSLSSIIAPN